MLATTPTVIGASHDGRTNRWRITCPSCTKVFEPPTTMFAHTGFDCPKCGAELGADFNAPLISLRKSPLDRSYPHQ